MRHLLFQTEHLANEIVSRLSNSSDEDIVSPPTLTRDIFGVTETAIPVLLKTDEFSCVCEAVDFLVESGRVTFNCETGHVSLLAT